MRKLLPAFLVTAFLLATQVLLAQQPDEPVQMADGLRADGKIWVVVAVVVTILVGLFAYLLQLDRKISALEKK